MEMKLFIAKIIMKAWGALFAILQKYSTFGIAKLKAFYFIFPFPLSSSVSSFMVIVVGELYTTAQCALNYTMYVCVYKLQ